MTAAVVRLVDDPAASSQIAYLALRDAERLFSPARRSAEVERIVAALAARKDAGAAPLPGLRTVPPLGHVAAVAAR